ncbi:MAG TPA: SDR family oxidoreductase [Clostridia bacterium]
MRVLLIGGTGIISEAVSKLAIKKGFDLYLLNRGKRDEFTPAESKQIITDIRNIDAAQKALSGHKFDVVVDFVAFTPEHVAKDVNLFNGKTDQYIFISSASAYQKPPVHHIITESTPLSNPYWQYSRDKIACEEALINEYRKSGFPVTIVRPSLTYGDTMIPAAMNSWNHPWSLIDRMKRGKKIIIQGDGTSLWTMTHNTDFAKGLTGLFGKTTAIGHAFHITSDEVLTWNQIHEAIANAAGVKPEVVHVPSDFIIHVSKDYEGTLLGDKSQSAIFDNSKIKSFVPDFVATMPFSEGVKKSVAWFKAHPERCTVDASWDEEMDRILEMYERAFL